jgi:formamidopyrimidine-DNA glycosylase
MPELPEVEVVRLGISPHILHKKIADVIIRHPRLRFPVPSGLKEILLGKRILEIRRRGKYLLFLTSEGTLIWHLGMSGSLRILTEPLPPKKHDHVDLIFSKGLCLRFNDPRRFGALLWTRDNPLEHPLLATLGPEPLSEDFNADYLWKKARTRTVAIKNFVMNSKIVVGVGNIYAAEALFQAKLHPLKPANKVSREEFTKLCQIIRDILRQAIQKGGTTLKDFVNSAGKPGYFKQELQVYGRGGEPCMICKTELRALRVGQRGTVFCPRCQKK